MNQRLKNTYGDTMVDIYSGTVKKAPKAGLSKGITALIVTGALLACAAAAFGGVQLYRSVLQDREDKALLAADTFYEGTVVAGVELGGKTMKEALSAVKPLETGLLAPCDITITHGDKSWKVTQDDLDYKFDTEAVLDEAYAYARTGSDEERLRLIKALKTTPKKYDVSSTFTYDRLEEKLGKIAEEATVAPVDATVVSFDAATAAFQFADGKNGVSVDSAKLYRDVESLIEGAGVGTVELPAETVPFGVTLEQLKSRMQKLGSWSTISTNSADGNHNMKLAAAAINGSVIKPGGVFSFNEATGDSNKPENGYRKAVAISGGKKVMEYGGGVCQVSTTLYGAAIRSNMEITNRANHMWVSSYAPIGLDATVSYPYLDFQFKNPTDYPVYIVAGMSGTKVTVTLYGYQPPDYDKIEATSQQTETVAQPADEYQVDESLKKGTKILDRKGNPGKRAVAQRVFYKNGAVVRTENLPSSYYRPVSTVYKIAPDTDHNVPVAGGETSSGSSAQTQNNQQSPNSQAA